MSALEHYLEKVEIVRGNLDELFILVRDPSGPTKNQTIARWCKDILKKAGIENYGVHSVRSASTCGALIRGIPLDTIIKQAGWSQVNTFIRNYLKPLNCAASNQEECEKVRRATFPHSTNKEQSLQLSQMCQINLMASHVDRNMTLANASRYQNADNTGNLIRGRESKTDNLTQATVGHDTPPKKLINTGYGTRLVNVRRETILKKSHKFQKKFIQSNKLSQGK